MHDNLENAISKYDATIKIENWGKTRCSYCHSQHVFNGLACIDCFLIFSENPQIIAEAVVQIVSLDIGNAEYGIIPDDDYENDDDW